MNEAEASKLIREHVAVTQQKVVMAKTIVLGAATSDCTSDSLVHAVLVANDAEMPRQVVLHDSVNPLPAIIATANALSWSLAGAEAIWSLIHSGLLFPLSDVRGDAPSVQWTTVIPGSGGMSSGWRFEEFFIPTPGRLRRAPSSLQAGNQFLTEPDLYLRSLNIANMHAEVVAAFRESVQCFRHEFFTSSLAMLGKASEGAWLELGTSLVACIPKADEGKFSKQRTALEDPMTGTFRKIESVLTIYDHQEVFGPISKSSGVRLQELRSVAVWSDAVRDSRNTIHFGVAPATPNTYEKLAALLIGAVSNVRVLYRVKEVADATSATGNT